MTTRAIAINAIQMGERVRRDLGDIQGLADSIQRHGLLHPIVVKSDGTLVAGQRRIEAARLLGCTEIAATVVDVVDLLGAERDENAERKDFTPTEAVAIGKLIEEQHRVKVAAARSEIGRQSVALRGDRSSRTEKLVVTAAVGSTRATAAHAVGMSEITYDKAKRVVAAAEAEPEKFGDLPALMDETGNVSGAHREMQRRQTNQGRHPVHKNTRHRDQRAEMRRAVWQAEAAAKVIASIDPGALKADERAEWADALEKVRVTLTRALRGLRK